jgi:hypothetical protein
MTNWQHFKSDAKYYLGYLRKPDLHVIKEGDESDYYARNYLSKEAVACYRAAQHTVIIREKQNIFPIRLHEYGHWINKLIYCMLEMIWEFIWWGLSVRNLFIKGNNNDL